MAKATPAPPATRISAINSTMTQIPALAAINSTNKIAAEAAEDSAVAVEAAPELQAAEAEAVAVK